MNPQLESHRLKTILISIGISLAGMTLLTFYPASDWKTGLALNAINLIFLLAHIRRFHDRLFIHLIIFGLIFGAVELIADAWLVDKTLTLDYSIGGGPMLWRSPVYMPLAWAIVVVQLSYVGLRLVERFGKSGILLNAIVGGVNIPIYEELALKTHWWRYGNCKMIGHTPYYIIGGEFLIAAGLAIIAPWHRREQFSKTCVGGILAGLSTWAGYWLAFTLTDGTL